VRVEVGEGVSAMMITLDDLIRLKQAAGRGKDRAELPILEALRDELDTTTRDGS
jgi:predicted nucleotidyltransferase